MNTYKSAPKLENRKPKSTNFYQIDADIFQVAAQTLSAPALRLFVVLSGTGDGFHPSAEFVCTKASVNKSNYSRYRKELVTEGFLIYTTNCDVIEIDYKSIQDKISRLADEFSTIDESVENSFCKPDEQNRKPDENIRLPDEIFRQPEVHNIETEKTKNNKQEVVVNSSSAQMDSIYKSRVNKFCESFGNIAAANAVKRLRDSGRSDEWIHLALTTESIDWKKNDFGLLFGTSEGCNNFRSNTDAKYKAATVARERREKAIAEAAAQPKLPPITIPYSCGTPSKSKVQPIDFDTL